ncbi:efflux transporter [Dinoroseobacter shibae DFL 12 = DSM 16493]|jgi:multidrug efflux pump subunit AcrB|uniref:Efflux transporter n=1 Tax=Dinoroseobacter shibae (strain DSM 16493 / NCIMB 14021 / DFL 12) TaxID=398580 RepID=A8LL65_DINSH|nr:efflux RND transporter permease subunit [Dinoroseobacter shibae]ABV94814.1 efflux transporter [Dinoroseobacter shibae DFL 12 = DSM 16493]URF46234.1 efflux RND transporter permease subunit [Dinoroseobacter shibae]URF50541.1 efflux RND transporter permease subunit [Dinoroseobacter shibae]
MGALGGILTYFTRHRTAANLLLLMLLAIGFAVIPQMRTQFFPDVVVDDITVQVSWDGAGAEDVDRAIVSLLEPALQAVEGVTESDATAREGSARISVEFEPGWDMSRATDDVRAAMDAITDLPEDAEEPVIRRNNWRDRITDVVVHGPVGVDQLARFSDEFVARLFEAGVTRTTIRGIAAPETLVEVATLDLIRHDLTLREIADVIAGAVDSAPSGDIAGGSARVRTGTETRSAEDLAALPLRTDADGNVLTVGDVATIFVGGVDRDRAYFVGANPAISVRVDRSEEGDAIAIQAQVAEVAEALERDLPAGVRIELIRTRAEQISSRLNILVDNGLLGLALVVGLLFLFLNARTAFWVAAGIPVAMMAAMSLMYLGGLTLNMVSLFALIITLGIVVDDAIVVGEHADYRARYMGEDGPTAAANAAIRMAPPVFTATITTVIAFFGLTAIGGSFGNLIYAIPFTVIAVLLASLVECFLILPNHMAHALAHSAREHWYDWPSRQVNRGLDWVKRVLFRRLIAFCIAARYPVFAGAIVLLLAQAALFVRGDVTWRFFNAPERGSITGNFAMLPGATREDTFEAMRLIQQGTDEVAARYEAEHGLNPLAFVLTEVGGTTGRGLAGADSKDTDQLGSIAIDLIDADLRPYSSFTFLADLQDAVPRHPMLETLSFRGWRSGPGGDALSVEFYGADTETLKAAAEALKTRLAIYPEVSALEDSLAYDKQELILDLTPTGSQLGFDIDALGRELRARLNGIEAATYPVGTRTGAIRVELPAAEIGPDFLDRMLLRTPSGAYVPLADIVSVRSQEGFSRIQRENGLRVVSVTGDISEDDPVRAAEINTLLIEEHLPRIQEEFGVNYVQTGLAEQERAFLTDATIGFLLCLVGIYLCLAWIFSSWTRPAVVMVVIPFGLIGAIWGHYVWDVPLSMFSVVGLIGMAGIIINDSIVLVSTIDEYGKERGLVPAIIDGTVDRLRPVLLTTLTTVLGLTPLLYEGSQQAQFLKPTVITLVYGLGFGMVLVLILVPAFMAMQQDIGRQLAALRRALGAPLRAGGAGRAAILATALCAGWAAATFGVSAVTGALPAPLADMLPAGLSAPMATFVAFLGGVCAIALATWLLSALILGLRGRARLRGETRPTA